MKKSTSYSIPRGRIILQSWRRLAGCVIVVLVIIGCFAEEANSQTLGQKEDSSRPQATTMKRLLEPFAQSVVQIRNQNRRCCLGTLVGDGLVVTKRSELSGSLTCVAKDGAQLTGVIIAEDSLDDLALIQLSQNDSAAESFSKAVEFEMDGTVEPGDIMVSVGQQVQPISIGIATVAAQVIPIRQPVCRDCVDLGLMVAKKSTQVEVELTAVEGQTAGPQQVMGTRVKRVYPRTVAERIGLLKGDLLLSINRQWVSDSESLRSIGSSLRVGQALNVIVVRAGSLKELEMDIDHFSRRVYHDRWGGGPFSERRFGFDATIVHDSLLKPDQCGGPLVDLDGKLLGINIARSMRVATVAVPADRVINFINRYKPVANIDQ